MQKWIRYARFSVVLTLFSSQAADDVAVTCWWRALWARHQHHMMSTCPFVDHPHCVRQSALKNHKNAHISPISPHIWMNLGPILNRFQRPTRWLTQILNLTNGFVIIHKIWSKEFRQSTHLSQFWVDSLAVRGDPYSFNMYYSAPEDERLISHGSKMCSCLPFSLLCVTFYICDLDLPWFCFLVSSILFHVVL